MNDHLLTSSQLVTRFRVIRRKRGMSVQDVANATGINRSVLANLENGRRATLTIDEAKAIADALNVDLIACLQPIPIEVIPAVTA